MTPPKKPSRPEYVDVDVLVSEKTRTPPEELVGYKPFIGVPSKLKRPENEAGVPPAEEPSPEDKPAA